ANLEQVFSKGLWCARQRFSLNGDVDAEWRVETLDEQGASFRVRWRDQSGEVRWDLSGRHNVQNAVAALAAAAHAGVPLANGCASLCEFAGVKRRLELFVAAGCVQVYDDFAHHPAAIRTTLEGMHARLRERGETGRVIAVIEARSNTMKMGYHQHTLAGSLG